MEEQQQQRARTHRILNDLRFAPEGLLAQAARKFWQQARSSESALAWRRAGDASRGLGDFDAAVEAYEQAAALDQDDRFSRQAARLCRDGEPDAALLDAGPPAFVLRCGTLAAYRESILQALESGSAQLIEAGLSLGEQAHTNPSVRSAHLQHLKKSVPWVAEARSALWRELSRAAPLLGVRLPERERLGLQLDLTVYRDGGFYRPHTDNAQPRDDGVAAYSRLLSFVAYFHLQPRPFAGGDLLLYDQPDGRGALTRIEPLDGRLIIFPSQGLLHEITPVRSQATAWQSGRITLNGWVHRLPEPAEAQHS